MATEALSPLAGSEEKTNGTKLIRLLIDGGTVALRKTFDRYHPPHRLVQDLNTNYSILENLLKEQVLNGHQWDKLFPPGGVAPDSNTFDITLLFLLLTTICGLRAPPHSGWHNKPNPKNKSPEANISRVKFYRNKLIHKTTTGVDTEEFSSLWDEISAPLLALGLNKEEVARLKGEKSGEENYLQALRDWFDSDEKVKSQLKNINKGVEKIQKTSEEVQQTLTEMQRTNSEVRQTQLGDQKTLKEIKQSQSQTKLTLEEIRLKNTEDQEKRQDSLDKVLEEIQQSHSKTKETVEGVNRQIVDIGTRTLEQYEELTGGIQEIKETFDTLKAGRDKKTDDAVLRNLVKSEFKGDIEYYAERFQEGTREWVFDRVQNWLDDRCSQHRVMVISGIAGMGKSVVSAVICKRMQEAGRLSGSHFCQVNNVRYSKPQLMIQSLSCHLSDALPEYKQALVGQLSRNLGTDLNNMGVEELFALLFKEPLRAVGDPGRNMLMVIDGLDESEYQGRNELLDVIANQFCKLPIWIRFLVTTRPALNIADKLIHLKPLKLKSNDEENIEDVRVFCLKRLQHVVKLENVSDFIEQLVLKSEGLMLYAHFLILAITETPSIFHEGDLVGSSQPGISAVYHSYFERLERELIKELNIMEEHFLNLLSAITASREPLPVGFVSKILVPSTNSPLTRRKVLRTLNSVSALLPVRDDCLHVFHKSVQDWLTGVSSYGEHEFIVDESQGHRILATLCTDELENLKRKGVRNMQFGVTERYALYHGAHHMLHEDGKRVSHKLDELTKAYIIDLEIVYAKTLENGTIASEDLVWLKRRGIFTLLSKDNQSIVDTLLFLLRKNLRLLTDSLRRFLQTILNQGGKVLSVAASNLLQNKYPEIPYMEVVHKEMQRTGVVAKFECSSAVLCLDVSPQLDYMVCECSDGMLQLWSLQTGRLVWTRPVVVEKSFKKMAGFPNVCRNLPSVDALSLFRSVVFHPTKECILPGILSQAYTMDGDLKPLFPGSNCRFSVCSISGDKTKILTNCLESSKCVVLWSLESGSEVDRILEDEDILSFAWSGDGRLLAISHCSGVISLYDVMCNFRKLTQMDTPDVFGMVKFSPDHRFILCCAVTDVVHTRFFSIKVVKDVHNTKFCSTEVFYDYENFDPSNDCGFLFGDLIPKERRLHQTMFVLDKQRLLRSSGGAIEMEDTKDIKESYQGVSPGAKGIALSLDAQTVFVASETSVTAYDMSSGKLKAEINCGLKLYRLLCPVRGGVLILTNESTVELWSGNLAKRIKRWTNLLLVKQVIPISEERVAVVSVGDVKVLDTISGKVVLTIPVLQGRVLTCNSKCQLLYIIKEAIKFLRPDPPCSLQLLDGKTVVWRKEVIEKYLVYEVMAFSPTEHFLVVGTTEGILVLDAETGNTLRTLRPSTFSHFWHFTFISDDRCVAISKSDLTLQLLNVKSGELVTAIDVESNVSCLAACPFNRVLAIGLPDSTPNFRVIRVHLLRGDDIENGKR